MILNFNEYQIVTDDLQFIVKRKKVVQAGPLTKEENIGKEYWEDSGYFSSIDSALKFLSKRVLLDNDDILIIREKLDEIERDIKEFSSLLKLKK